MPYKLDEGNLRFRCQYRPDCSFTDERASKVETHLRGVHLNLRYKCALYWCTKTVHNKAEIMTHLENYHHFSKELAEDIVQNNPILKTVPEEGELLYEI